MRTYKLNVIQRIRTWWHTGRIAKYIKIWGFAGETAVILLDSKHRPINAGSEEE